MDYIRNGTATQLLFIAFMGMGAGAVTLSMGVVSAAVQQAQNLEAMVEMLPLCYRPSRVANITIYVEVLQSTTSTTSPTVWIIFIYFPISSIQDSRVKSRDMMRYF